MLWYDEIELKNGKVTILFNKDGLTIELIDGDASITFAKVELDAEQTCNALSRLAHTSAKITVHDLAKVGRKMEIDEIVFEIPEDVNVHLTKDKLKNLAQKNTPLPWFPDLHFGSKDSIFYGKDGKKYAKTIIRRWI